MSSLLNSVQSSDPPMPMGMDNFFKELYPLCQFDNVRTLHLQTLLRRDDDTMVAETFYKRQSVPSFVQTLSWKTMRTRPQHQYSLIRSSLSLSGARQEWDNAVGVRGARVGQPYPLAIDLSGGWTRNIPNHQSCPHLLLILSFAFEVITAINNPTSRVSRAFIPNCLIRDQQSSVLIVTKLRSQF